MTITDINQQFCLMYYMSINQPVTRTHLICLDLSFSLNTGTTSITHQILSNLEQLDRYKATALKPEISKKNFIILNCSNQARTGTNCYGTNCCCSIKLIFLGFLVGRKSFFFNILHQLFLKNPGNYTNYINVIDTSGCMYTNITKLFRTIHRKPAFGSDKTFQWQPVLRDHIRCAVSTQN